MEGYCTQLNRDDGQANAGSAEGSIPEEWDIDGTFLYAIGQVILYLLKLLPGSYSLMVRGGRRCCWEFKRDFSSGLMQVLGVTDVYCGCKLNVVVMEADVPAELEGLVRVDVELTLFIKVSSPFLLYL
jgi:hypothetical protein